MFHSTFDNARSGGTPISLACDSLLNVCVTLHAVLDLHIALSPKVEEEDGHYRREDDSWTPGVTSPALGHPHAGLRPDFAVGRVEQMNESCGDYDAGAEVPGKQIN